jgi:hypothetical protein
MLTRVQSHRVSGVPSLLRRASLLHFSVKLRHFSRVFPEQRLAAFIEKGSGGQRRLSELE